MWVWVCEFIVMWVRKMSVEINVSVWVMVMVFVINWTIGMGRSAEKIHYFLQIYITSRNTLNFTWLLIIHRWGICPRWVWQKLVIFFSNDSAHHLGAYASSTGKASTTDCSLPRLYDSVLIYAVLACSIKACQHVDSQATDSTQCSTSWWEKPLCHQLVLHLLQSVTVFILTFHKSILVLHLILF